MQIAASTRDLRLWLVVLKLPIERASLTQFPIRLSIISSGRKSVLVVATDTPSSVSAPDCISGVEVLFPAVLPTVAAVESGLKR